MNSARHFLRQRRMTTMLTAAGLATLLGWPLQAQENGGLSYDYRARRTPVANDDIPAQGAIPPIPEMAESGPTLAIGDRPVNIQPVQPNPLDRDAVYRNVERESKGEKSWWDHLAFWEEDEESNQVRKRTPSANMTPPALPPVRGKMPQADEQQPLFGVGDAAATRIAMPVEQSMSSLQPVPSRNIEQAQEMPRIPVHVPPLRQRKEVTWYNPATWFDGAADQPTPQPAQVPPTANVAPQPDALALKQGAPVLPVHELPPPPVVGEWLPLEPVEPVAGTDGKSSDATSETQQAEVLPVPPAQVVQPAVSPVVPPLRAAVAAEVEAGEPSFPSLAEVPERPVADAHMASMRDQYQGLMVEQGMLPPEETAPVAELQNAPLPSAEKPLLTADDHEADKGFFSWLAGMVSGSYDEFPPETAAMERAPIMQESVMQEAVAMPPMMESGQGAVQEVAQKPQPAIAPPVWESKKDYYARERSPEQAQPAPVALEPASQPAPIPRPLMEEAIAAAAAPEPMPVPVSEWVPPVGEAPVPAPLEVPLQAAEWVPPAGEQPVASPSNAAMPVAEQWAPPAEEWPMPARPMATADTPSGLLPMAPNVEVASPPSVQALESPAPYGTPAGGMILHEPAPLSDRVAQLPESRYAIRRMGMNARGSYYGYEQ